jgi:hypothetical protein
MSKPKKKFPVINYYEKWADGDDNDELNRYPNEDLMQIRIPFRALMVGPTNSGKTNITMNLISGIGIWDTVVILAKDLEEKLYKCAIREIRKMEEVQKRKILTAIDNIEDLQPINSFNREQNHLMIIDDFVFDNPKTLDILNEIWGRGRKQRISPVFITQSYFRTPIDIRRNSDYVFIKRLGGAKDAPRIAAEYALDATKEQIVEMFKSTQNQTDPETGRKRDPATEFFLIDPFARDPALRFRDQFEPMEIPPERPKKKLISARSIPALK